MKRSLSAVADKVGVSEATVSRVLNGRPGVSAATRTAVLTALDVLGYERPTKLRGKRARLVGLVLPELNNPIFPALAEVVGGALAQLHFTPVLCASGPNGLSEPEYVTMLLDQHASGVIFAGGNFAEANSSHEHYRLLHERAVPVVLVNASSEDLTFPQVATDDAVAAEQAFSHLRALGHDEIGMILGPEDHMPSRLRLASFLAVAKRAGIKEAGRVEHVPFSLEAGHAAATRLVGRGITGIICSSDPLALGAIRAARRLGLRVPDDISDRRLRRFRPHDLHRPASYDDPSTDRGNGPGRREAFVQPDRRHDGQRRTSAFRARARGEGFNSSPPGSRLTRALAALQPGVTGGRELICGVATRP